MIKPSSDFPQNEADTHAGEHNNPREAQGESPSRELTAEERREKFKAALEHVNRKFGRALRKLAE